MNPIAKRQNEKDYYFSVVCHAFIFDSGPFFTVRPFTDEAFGRSNILWKQVFRSMAKW